MALPRSGSIKAGLLHLRDAAGGIVQICITFATMFVIIFVDISATGRRERSTMTVAKCMI
jgi:hypothetical protein